jgi:hypothetical protein
MLWIDYTIEQSGPHFKIKGDWDKEVMKKGLFKPGDIFIVNEQGWLIKSNGIPELFHSFEQQESKIECTNTEQK